MPKVKNAEFESRYNCCIFTFYFEHLSKKTVFAWHLQLVPWKRHVLSLDQVKAGCIIWFIEVCNSAWDKLFKVTGPTLQFFYCFIACLEGGWLMIKTENNAVHKIHRYGDGSLRCKLHILKVGNTGNILPPLFWKFIIFSKQSAIQL